MTSRKGVMVSLRNQEIPVLPQGLSALSHRHAQVSGLVIDEYEIACRMGWHTHDELALCLILGGSGHYKTRGQEFTHSAGQVLIEPPGVAQQHETPYTRCVNIQVPGTLYSDLQTRRDWLETVRCHSGGPALRALQRINRELSIGDGATRLAIHGLVLQILAFLSRSRHTSRERRRPSWVNRVEQYLAANYLAETGLEAIASEVGLHPAHVARTFKRHAGRTLGEHVRGLRVAHAMKLLESTDLPLAAVAQESGFCDQSSLTHTFRLVTGRTPGQIRRARRNRTTKATPTQSNVPRAWY